MANLETLAVLRPVASHMLVSEHLEPGHGWDYRWARARWGCVGELGAKGCGVGLVSSRPRRGIVFGLPRHVRACM